MMANMEPEQPLSPYADWRKHLDLASEYWGQAAGGKKELARLAEREFVIALEMVPPSLDDHMALLDVAARNGRLNEVRGQYFVHESDWPFAAEMLARISAIEKAQAIAHEVPASVRNGGNLLKFGGFIFGARDILMWGSKRVLGPHGPLIVAIILMALMLYMIWPFVYSMYLLWRAY